MRSLTGLSIRLALLSTVLLAAFVVVACSGSETPAASPSGSPTPSPTPVNPEIVLQEAGRVMQNVASFAFMLQHRRGGTPLPLLPGLILDEAEGEVVKPDRIAASFNGTIRNSLFLKSSLITIGDASFMTNPLNGKWESVPPDVSPLGFFNPREGVAAMMLQVEGASLINSNYEDTYRIVGKLPVEALAPLFGETVTGTMIDVDLTIKSDDLYLTRAELNGRVTEGEQEGVIRVVTLSRINESLTIEPPVLN